MKIKDTAMGSWFRTLDEIEASLYIASALQKNNDPSNVFWAIVEKYDLKAKEPIELGYKVLERLMDFDLDEMDSGEGDV